jgi:cell division septation protein DedD
MLPLSFVTAPISVEAPTPEIPTTIVLSVPAAPAKAKAAKQTVQKVVAQKMYHLVIGSFPNEREAKQCVTKLNKANFPNHGIITRQGRTRVYAAKFKQRNDAETFLSQLRQNKKHQDAWLYAAK